MQTIEVGAGLDGVARYIGGAEAKLDPLGLPHRPAWFNLDWLWVLALVGAGVFAALA